MQRAANVPLAPLTTLGLGGPARELAVLDDITDFPELVAHPAQCRFGHRSSIFKNSQRWTILTVTFKLVRSMRRVSPSPPNQTCWEISRRTVS